MYSHSLSTVTSQDPMGGWWLASVLASTKGTDESTESGQRR